MAKFRRIVTRTNELGEVFDNNPIWKEGYEFESADFNGIEELGSTYARDLETGIIHSWSSIERID